MGKLLAVDQDDIHGRQSRHTITDKACLERIQRRVTKMVKGVRKLKYKDRLKQLGIYSLERRRLRGDLKEAYKTLSGKERLNKNKFFILAQDNHGLQGHSQKLFKPKCRTTATKTFFINRIINDWNNLPQEVIDTTIVNIFKNRLDKTWRDMGIYSWEATSHIGYKFRYEVCSHATMPITFLDQSYSVYTI